MSEELNAISRSQIIIVEPPSGSVSVINAGPQGPAGPPGEDGGSGSGGDSIDAIYNTPVDHDLWQEVHLTAQIAHDVGGIPNEGFGYLSLVSSTPSGGFSTAGILLTDGEPDTGFLTFSNGSLAIDVETPALWQWVTGTGWVRIGGSEGFPPLTGSGPPGDVVTGTGRQYYMDLDTGQLWLHVSDGTNNYDYTWEPVIPGRHYLRFELPGPLFVGQRSIPVTIGDNVKTFQLATGIIIRNFTSSMLDTASDGVQCSLKEMDTITGAVTSLVNFLGPSAGQRIAQAGGFNITPTKEILFMEVTQDGTTPAHDVVFEFSYDVLF